MSNQTNQPIFQVLSLDVVLGALCVGIFAIKLLNVAPEPAWFLVLPGAVWSVYTLDHLLDGWKRKGKSQIYRHQYHYKNRKAFIFSLLAVSCVTIGLTFTFLDKNIRIWGIYLSLIVFGYFALHYFSGKKTRSYYQKELLIAAVYISGIFLAPLVWYSGQPDTELVVIIAILFLLAWTESNIISFYDFELDSADKLDSFATTYGKSGTRTFLIILLSCIIILLFFWLLAGQETLIRSAIIILQTMSILLLLLILFPDYFSHKCLFRWIGEGVFVLPALILVV